MWYSSAYDGDNVIFIHMITDFESMKDVQLTGKNMTDSVCDRGTSSSGRFLKVHEQLVVEESTSKD